MTTGRTEFTVEGAQKAVAAAITAGAALVGFFVAVEPSTVQSIVAVVGALFNVVAVYLTTNKPKTV